MDSSLNHHEKGISSFLTLQQGAAQYYKDEPRLIEILLDEVFNLSGAECIIVKKDSGAGSKVIGDRHATQSAYPVGEILEAIDDWTVEWADSQTVGDRGRVVNLEPPLVLKKGKYTISRIFRISLSLNVKMNLELLLINGTDEEVIYPLMEGLIRLAGEALLKADLEEELQVKSRSLAKTTDSKTQFFGNLSHEIRSPLNGIVCMASLLRESNLDEEQLDLLNIIQFSADNITRIIQDLVDLTLLSSGQVILKNETFSLSTLCRNLMKNLKEEAESKGLKLEYHIDEKVDSFHGDSVRVGQILSNLIQNGIKYTKEGEIFLDIRRSEGNMEFMVSDTGVGIPREKQDMIFEEFTQLGNPVRKDKARGVGLGLAIVKDLVDIMGGSVSVKSREGKGSSFRVILPDSDVGDSVVNPVEKKVVTSPRDGSFLVVDDDEINRLYLKMVLEGLGARIEEAENGRIAVEKVAANQYDMILMDISMPVMNGLEATKEIRKMKKDLPVLAVTANAFEEDFKRILEAGLDDIVLKPVDESKLMNKISNWLGRSGSHE
ncbi:MAG: response regulator [Spirochaetales bacterium]|nr:response regulator [Spirochaetales bacterium]